MTLTEDKRVNELLDRVDNYGFECEAGPLKNCKEWIELRDTFVSVTHTFHPTEFAGDWCECGENFRSNVHTRIPNTPANRRERPE